MGNFDKVYPFTTESISDILGAAIADANANGN